MPSTLAKSHQFAIHSPFMRIVLSGLTESEDEME